MVTTTKNVRHDVFRYAIEPRAQVRMPNINRSHETVNEADMHSLHLVLFNSTATILSNVNV